MCLRHDATLTHTKQTAMQTVCADGSKQVWGRQAPAWLACGPGMGASPVQDRTETGAARGTHSLFASCAAFSRATVRARCAACACAAASSRCAWMRARASFISFSCAAQARRALAYICLQGVVVVDSMRLKASVDQSSCTSMACAAAAAFRYSVHAARHTCWLTAASAAGCALTPAHVVCRLLPADLTAASHASHVSRPSRSPLLLTCASNLTGRP